MNYLGPKSTASAKSVAAGLPRTTSSAAQFRQIEERDKAAVAARRPSSAAQFRKIEERDKAAIAARKPKGPKLPTGRIPKAPARPKAPVSPVVAPVQEAPVEEITPEKLDAQLAPLTIEQEEQLATQNRQLQAEYDRLAAAFTKQDAEARAAEQQARGLAQNIAAGESQNLRTQLASIGMDESPGPAIVGQESIAAQSAAQQAAARGSLSQLLAQIEADKAKAEAQRLLGQTDLEKVRNQLRIGNSMADLQSMFEQFGDL